MYLVQNEDDCGSSNKFFVRSITSAFEDGHEMVVLIGDADMIKPGTFPIV